MGMPGGGGVAMITEYPTFCTLCAIVHIITRALDLYSKRATRHYISTQVDNVSRLRTSGDTKREPDFHTLEPSIATRHPRS